MKDLKDVQLPTLSDGRLVVRPWRPDDAPAVCEACQDPEIPRWTTLPVPYEYRHATEFLAHAWRDWIDEASAHFAVVAADGGRLLGAVSLMIDVQAEVGDLGYWVAPWARRQRVASSAVKLVSAWGLDELELPRVQIRFLPENVASRRVTEACGFAFEGVLRSWFDQRGERVDNGVASLLRGEPRPW